MNIWGKNLTDEFVVSGAFAVSTSRTITGTYLPPRQYGVTVGYRILAWRRLHVEARRDRSGRCAGLSGAVGTTLRRLEGRFGEGYRMSNRIFDRTGIAQPVGHDFQAIEIPSRHVFDADREVQPPADLLARQVQNGALKEVDQLAQANPYSPEITVNASIGYEIALGGDATLTPRVSIAHTSSQYAAIFQNTDYFRVPGRTTMDAFLILAAGDWGVNAFVRNLTDKHYVTGVANAAAF